jgi:hypothetical protein
MGTDNFCRREIEQWTTPSDLTFNTNGTPTTSVIAPPDYIEN